MRWKVGNKKKCVSKVQCKRKKRVLTHTVCWMPTVWVSCTCAQLSHSFCVDVWSAFRSSASARRPRHISIIPQFNNRQTFEKQKPLSSASRRWRQGEEKWESLWLFQTYRFHVNGHWNAKILVCLFPTRFLSFSSVFSFFFFFFFSICSSFPPKGSGSWTWYAKLPAVSVVPLAMHCKLVNSAQKKALGGICLAAVTNFIVFGKWRDRRDALRSWELRPGIIITEWLWALARWGAVTNRGSRRRFDRGNYSCLGPKLVILLVSYKGQPFHVSYTLDTVVHDS